MDVDTDSIETNLAILAAIDKFQHFLKGIGMPSTLSEIGLNKKNELSDIACRCAAIMPSGTIGNFVRLKAADIETILESCF